MVICGEWGCSELQQWEFDINKFLLSRIVPITHGMKLCELEEVVLKEFQNEVSILGTPRFSYLPPNIMDYTTGKKTPPILVTSEVGLKFFIDMFLRNRGLNLFVNFGEMMGNVITHGANVREECVAGKSVMRSKKSVFSSSSERIVRSDDDIGWEAPTAGSKTPKIPTTQDDEDVLAEVEIMDRMMGKGSPHGENVREDCVAGLSVIRSKKRVFSSSNERIERSDDDVGWEAPAAATKTPKILTTQDDEAVLAEVEVVEAMFTRGDEQVLSSGCEGKSITSGSSGDYEDILEDSEEELELGESEVEVSPSRYDTEFWGHFLDDELAGSNAPEIMCSPREISSQVEKGLQDGILSDGSAALPVGGQRENEARKLDEVDDEEFDIPPLFDDCEYERDEIPDLDIEDDEKGIFKGRVYASKQDCQISLAIHAIKEQFYFKQTRTKRHSFVLTCADERCQWRIMAHEMKTCGYYQIRKADLEHTCNIETRGQYMKKATSRVIASVYKAKYSQIAQGPVPMDLQQMVLEDLRVTASYSTCWRAREKAVEEVFGTDDDSYKALEDYLYVLKLANPDRNQSIYVAKKKVFPRAYHGACIVHLARNVNARFHNKGLANLVKNAGYAYTVKQFNEIYAQISMKNSECANYLERMKTGHWTRVYFQGVVTPEVDKVLTKNLAKVRGSKVGNVSTWSYEIVGLFNGKHQVCLDRKQCTCKEYNKLKIPCGHAMLAATSVGQSYGSLVAHFYKTAAWRATYEGVINPELNLEDVVIPNGIKSGDIYPPRTRRPSGRPKQLRIKSIGEFPVEIKDCEGWTICVCLLRVYKKFVNPNSYDICCILVDESGDQMEATIDRRFAAVYLESMKEKQWKTITTFIVRKISEKIRPTTNPYEIVGAIIEVGRLRNTTANMEDVNGYTINFKIMDRYKVVLTCEALGQTAIDFEENYRQYGRVNMIVALGWWKVVRPNRRANNVKIVSHGSISTFFPNPDIEEVEEIKMMID
ncbi:unnamed protein product [Arabidopsis halleri]